MPLQPVNRRRSRTQRRRDGQRRLAALIVTIVVVVVVIVEVTGGNSSKPARSASRSTAGRSSATRHNGTKANAKAIANPLTSAAMRSLLAGRQGQVSVAVDDLQSGHEWVLHPGARDQTASIIKMDILETLLRQTEASHTPITSVETPTAQGMIEASDNTDASALWNQIGEGSGLASYNRVAGLTQTTPNTGEYWGETLTSAADQIKLLRQLAFPSKLLTPEARRYELYLMDNIDPGENWGVTGGVARGVRVALKNGWVPLTSNTDWEVNSDGWVRGDGRDYLISVLTAHDPSEAYGISTINAASRLVFRDLGGSPAGSTTSSS